MAALRGQLENVKYFLSEGADINSRDLSDMTPLMKATICGCEDIVDCLVEAGANLNLVDAFGKTALITAIRTEFAQSSKKVVIVFTLLRAGANPNIGAERTEMYSCRCPEFGENIFTCVGEAAKAGELDIAKICLSFGARPLSASKAQYGRKVSEETKAAFGVLLGKPAPLESQVIRFIRDYVSKDNIAKLPVPPVMLKKCFGLSSQ